MGDTTMTEYTMEHVRRGFLTMFDVNADAAAVMFDRALAAHDAEVAANALRDAARATINGLDPERCRTIFDPWDVSESLHSRADRIEREATNHKPNPELGSSEGSDR